MSLKKYRYLSQEVCGDLHVAANYLSREHPEWDVIALSPAQVTTGPTTIIVYRESVEEISGNDHARLLSAARAAYHVLDASPHPIGDGQDVDQLVNAITDALAELQPFVK